MILASYICKSCEIEGKDYEESEGHVLCWNCGKEVVITARIARLVLPAQLPVLIVHVLHR